MGGRRREDLTPNLWGGGAGLTGEGTTLTPRFIREQRNACERSSSSRTSAAVNLSQTSFTRT